MIAPVRADDPVAQGAGNHPPMPVVQSQDVAPPAQRPQVVERVRAEFPASDVVDVRRRFADRGATADALPTVTLQHLAP